MPLPRADGQNRHGYIPTKPQTEAQLMIEIAPANSADTIVEAIGALEKMYMADASRTNCIPLLKSLLADTRMPVRCKAARVLGVFHAPMDEADLALIRAQLKASDWREVQSGLKTLRDLFCRSAIPDILPCLKHPNASVVRDACRTLAVVGTKDLIPYIKPLLNSPDEKVRTDAADAIDILRVR